MSFSGATVNGSVTVPALRNCNVTLYLLPIISASVAFLVATAGQRVLLRASLEQPQPGPVVVWNTDPLPGPGPSAVIDDPHRSDGSPTRRS